MRPICCAVLVALLSHAQAEGPRFEVASVQQVRTFAGNFPARRITGGPGSASPERIEYREQSLKDLIFIAYRVQFFQLKTPSWMEDAYFDVRATVPRGATREDLGPMLQRLLAERFKLKIRREPREVPGYVLRAAKGAAVLRESPPAIEASATGMPPRFDLDKDGFVIAPPGRTIMIAPERDGVVRLTAGRASMEIFCGFLGRQLQQPVADETGLPGVYDFHLAFAPEVSAPGNTAPPELESTRQPAATLVKAVEAQLGLRLESRRVRTDILVIEHVERTPTEN